jgi:chaperonin GroEL
VNVGAATEAELKEKKSRIEDALHATRAAVEEGVVPGGGVAMIRAMKALNGGGNLNLEGDEATGVKIVRNALTAPLRQIAENAGESGASSCAGDGIQEQRGWNALTDEYVDVMKAGILTPTKVERTACKTRRSCDPAAHHRLHRRREAQEEGRRRRPPPRPRRRWHGRMREWVEWMISSGYPGLSSG